MKKLISTLFTLIIYVSFCSAQSATEDSISQEDRIKAIAERIVKIPIVNEATKIDFSDIKTDMVFFKNNHLTGTTIENLVDFSDNPLYKPFTVKRILKYFYYHRFVSL